FRESCHLGVDFAMPKDTQLRTIADGVITKVVNQPEGLGKAVYVEWSNGYTAVYGHMNKVSVYTGQEVRTGDLIGYSGNTGNVVGENGGYHLHFAVLDDKGKFIDPEPYAPYIQEMNHDLLELVQQHSSSLDLSTFGNMLGKFVDGLSDMTINMIVWLFNHLDTIQAIIMSVYNP